METSQSPKFTLSRALLTRYRTTSDQLIENMEKYSKKYNETELAIYDNAKKIIQAAIGKLEIIISFGSCEFEYMGEVHKAILDYNVCTDKYEDILYEISLLPKSESKKIKK